MRHVALVTDFGDSPYTGILRAVAKSIEPNLPVIDICHCVQNFNVLAGAYVVYNTYRWTPKETVMTVVVDPGVGSSRPALAVRAGDYFFVGPDNGVLYPAIAKEGFLNGVSLDPETVVSLASKYFQGKLPGKTWQISDTFHGRDVFTPAAALIAIGHSLDELGTPVSLSDLKKLSLEYVERTEDGYRLKVVYIDKYGNVALSATRGAVPLRQWQNVAITTKDGTYRATVGRKFSDVTPGELVLYINSFGFLEIAANLGSAARVLGVSVGDKIVITPV